jgi:FkbM family methyltransferase
MKRIIDHASRFFRAAKLQLLWNGTTRFRLPRRFRFNSKLYCVDGPDEKTLAWVFRDVILDDEYGLNCLPRRPATILDIGGNIGLFSLWAGANFPEASIHVYEPNPALFNSLSLNVSQVGATVFPEGVSGQEGFGVLVEAGESMTNQCSVSSCGNISVSTLRTAIQRMGGRVDLLKIDCEGAEWEMLDDLEPFKHVRMLRMEYHLEQSNRSVGRLIDRLESVGFQLVKLQPNQGFGIAWFDR